LSPDELVRADRYVFPRHGQHYVLARAALRQVLGAALGAAPESLAFRYAAHGKPQLAGAHADSGLEFNVSHSGAVALIGWAFGAALGVDIEALRQTSDRDALVRRYFSAAENATYFALAAHLRQQAFFDCWSRKEALVKALGQGLSYPLKDFDVSLHPDEPARLQRLKSQPGEASGWCLTALPVAEGYAAALVIQGRDCHARPDV
jgi:4'-phosphopantetheinyl transferase